jgi:hypothetical protein
VGVLVDAPGAAVPALANTLSAAGMHASFAVGGTLTPADVSIVGNGDQPLPRLPNGGLVRWLRTRAQLHRLMAAMGQSHHFLYTSNGPSVGQWWLAHGAGGRLVAGAVRLDDGDDSLRGLHPGEVIELRVSSREQALPLLEKLGMALRAGHLTAVPVGRLLHDAGVSV